MQRNYKIIYLSTMKSNTNMGWEKCDQSHEKVYRKNPRTTHILKLTENDLTPGILSENNIVIMN